MRRAVLTSFHSPVTIFSPRWTRTRQSSSFLIRLSPHSVHGFTSWWKISLHKVGVCWKGGDEFPNWWFWLQTCHCLVIWSQFLGRCGSEPLASRHSGETVQTGQLPFLHAQHLVSVIFRAFRKKKYQPFGLWPAKTCDPEQNVVSLDLSSIIVCTCWAYVTLADGRAKLKTWKYKYFLRF